MDSSKRIKKIRALFVINIVMAVVLFIGAIVLCFIPTTSMAENFKGVSSTSISAMDMVLGNWDAKTVKHGEVYEESVDIYSLFPNGSIGPLDGVQGVIDFLVVCGIAYISLNLVLFLISFLNLYLSSKKKEQNGTLEIDKHFMKKFFDRPTYMFNFTTPFFVLIFALPFLLTIGFKNNDIFVPAYVLYVAIVYFVVVLVYPIIISNIVKKELDYISGDEMSEIFPKLANYSKALAAIKEREAAEEKEGSFLLKNEQSNKSDKKDDNIDKIKKYYDLYQQGIITEEEFNEKKKEFMDNDK